MSDFPSNSHKARETEKGPIEPVTSAEAVRRKPGLGRKFKDTFFGGTGKDAVEYAVTDVMVPSVKDLMHSFVTHILDHVFYGDGAAGRPRSRTFNTMTSSAPGTRINYGAYSSATTAHRPPPQQQLSQGARARHDLGELLIRDKHEAEEVLDRMYDILMQDNVVTVAQLYSLTGIKPEHTDFKWGWTNLKGSRAIHKPRQGGYILSLPRPEAVA